MLFFFQKTDVPDNSDLSITVSGNTQFVGLRSKLSVDGGPTLTLDPSQSVPLRSPHNYVISFDVVTLQAASVTVDAIVTTPTGNIYGTPFSQPITGQAGDLFSLRCDLTMTL